MSSSVSLAIEQHVTPDEKKLEYGDLFDTIDTSPAILLESRYKILLQVGHGKLMAFAVEMHPIGGGYVGNEYNGSYYYTLDTNRFDDEILTTKDRVPTGWTFLANIKQLELA